MLPLEVGILLTYASNPLFEVNQWAQAGNYLER